MLFSVTLSPTSSHVAPASLRKSFCGSVITRAVSWVSICICMLLRSGSRGHLARRAGQVMAGGAQATCSTLTPRQKATWPAMAAAASVGSG